MRWFSIPEDPKGVLQFFGTIDRRRAGARMALRKVREALPDVRVVDYEALTAALPADYCIDGEHWGCSWSAWQWREKTPYQCRALGNIAAANIVANMLCNV